MDSRVTNRIDIPDSSLNHQIEKAKNELEDMIDLNPQVIILLDRNGKIVRANKATLTFFNLVDFSSILNKDMGSLLGNSNQEALKGLLIHAEGYRNIQVPVNIGDKETRSVQLSIVGSGRAGEFSVLIVSDASEETKKARDLEKKHKKEAVQALTGALMHNINQPLTVIMMRAQMVKLAIQQSRIDPAEVRRSLDDIMKLSMTVADTLQAVGKPRDFVTEEYVEGVEILDLQKSSNPNAPIDLTCSTMLDVLLVTLEKRISGATLHAKRCGELAYRLAQLCGIENGLCEIARQAGFVHDLGKLAIPDSILLKQSELGSDEMALMRSHADTGYQIVRSLIFLEDEAEAVRQHHEYFDGSGYPQGLAGENISIAARVVAVADAFEVMITGRPYSRAKTLESAVAELSTGSGRQFDPAIAATAIQHAASLAELIQSIDNSAI